VRARDLLPNPKNWRKHPKAQADALRGLLAEVGYADALLARELPDGRLQLIDGHLRAETTPDSEVPVLILDVTEAEADKILLTLNPLGAMAEADSEAVKALLATVDTDSDAALVAPRDHLEEQIGLLAAHRQIADLVEDQKPVSVDRTMHDFAIACVRSLTGAPIRVGKIVCLTPLVINSQERLRRTLSVQFLEVGIGAIGRRQRIPNWNRAPRKLRPHGAKRYLLPRP